MDGSRTLSAAVAAALTLALGAPGVAAQIQQSPGHYHEGELGAKYLLVEQALKCNCGCGLDVHSCQFQMQCGTSPGWSARIRRDLEAGMTPEAVQASFVADFGPTVLMAPPPEGFNLVGYLLPSLAIVTAGMLVGLFVRGSSGGGGSEPVPAVEVSEDEMRRIREEMRRVDEAESPDW